jgi:light-independent protochlorophyllide reductase subunit B
VLYPEIAGSAVQWLERNHKQPFTRVVPIGYGATLDFIREVAALAGVDAGAVLAEAPSRMPWYSRSVDSTYLTGKRVFVFGDATHAIAAARIARDELGFEVVGLGCYNREFAREVRAAAAEYGLQALITDDYLEVEAAIAAAQPELVLGQPDGAAHRQAPAHPCAVISAPCTCRTSPPATRPRWGSRARA